MTKNVIFYFIKEFNNYTISQYNYLHKNKTSDIYIVIPNTVYYERFKFVDCAGVIEYDKLFEDYTVLEHDDNFNINKLRILKSHYETIFSIINKYDFVYFIEPTIRSKQDINELFDILNGNDHDFLSAYIHFVKGTDYKDPWYDTFCNIYDVDNYTEVISAYDGGIIRFSTAALNFLFTVNNPLVEFYGDIAIPTLLYLNGFTLNAFSNGSTTDNQFKCYGFCLNSNYGHNLPHKDLSQYTEDDVYLYNTFKEFEYAIDDILYKKENPILTVVMPVYNNESTLKEAILSVLSNNFLPDNNYELWCINDGSTDNSCEIIKEFADHPNIVFINRHHNGKINTLNFAFEKIQSKYIVRLNANDIMTSTRLNYQFNYMEEQTDVDILCSSVYNKKTGEYIETNKYIVSLKDLYDENTKLFESGMICRKSSLSKLPYLYEYYFEGAEFYKFILSSVIHGLNVVTDHRPITYYQVKNDKDTDILSRNRVRQIAKQLIDGFIEDEKHQMTAIVSFRNEYDEIERTVASIRATTWNMPIIVLNDASDNDYDYEFVARKYNCIYMHNEVASGVAGARMDAVKNVKTKYFIILDGHMRMYEQDWDLRAIDIIKKHGENNAYFGRTAVLSKNGTNFITNETGTKLVNTYGALLVGDKFTLTPKWITKSSEINFNNEETVVPVPILLGADYMMSVDFWNKIHGLEGLVCWGQDETLLSLKTWLAGSQVLLITDMIFGHVYRSKRPYSTVGSEMNSNYIYCNYLFSIDTEDYEELNYILKKHLGESWYQKAFDNFMGRFNETKEFKEYFYNNIATRDMNWFWEFNKNADPEQYEKYLNSKKNILSKMPK